MLSGQYLEIVANPKFEDVMRAIFIGRQVGEGTEKQRRIAEQHKRSMDSIHRARLEMQKQQRPCNPELDMLLVCVRGCVLPDDICLFSKNILSSFKDLIRT